MKPVFTVILDDRRALPDGRFPVKLRATFCIVKGGVKSWQLIHFSCKTEAGEKITLKNKKELEIIWNRPQTGCQVKLSQRLHAIRDHALSISARNGYLTIESFTQEFEGPEIITVGSLFEKYIGELKAAGRVGTMLSYQTALNSIRDFGGEPAFQEITPSWLDKYTVWMKTKQRKRTVVTKEGKLEEVVISTGSSINTIGIYKRCIRKIFHDAIQARHISQDAYPFGKGKHVIQELRQPKPALTAVEKNAVLDFQTDDKDVRRAVDFWIFSFLCNGMNFTDIAHLKRSDIKGDKLYFQRAKTINTARILIPVAVGLLPETLEIISRYGRRSLNPADYLFEILEAGLSPVQAKYKIQDFIDRTNTQLRKVASALGLGIKLTTYVARHTVGNTMIDAGCSKADVQLALAHGNIKTTEVYTNARAAERQLGFSRILFQHGR